MASPDLLEKLAAYVPTPVAQAIYHRPQPLTRPVGQRLPAAILYANISGLFSLRELLGSAGAQELGSLVNQYFTQMLQSIEAYHGQVVKYSGSTITAFFPATEASTQLAIRRAGECALAMQTQMSRFSAIETSNGMAGLSMKTGIGHGQVMACSVGGALGRWEYVVGGDPIIQAATAERQAKEGQVVVSPQAWEEVQEFFIGIPNINSRGFVNLFKPHVPLPELPPVKTDWQQLTPEEQDLSQTALQCYIPGAVTARLNTQSETLAELRQMAALFVGVGGLDYEADNIIERLQNLLQAVQEVTYRYEGSLGQVAVDDKGTTILLLFGAPPLFHDDDTTRAVTCALDLQTVAREQNLRMAIGITQGSIFAGPVGSAYHKEYMVISQEINLAARLMQYGRDGTIITSKQVKEKAGPHFIADNLGRITQKGTSLSAYLVKGKQGVQGEIADRYLLYKDPLIGRKAELEQIRRMAARARAGKLQPLFIEGELGMGKTRLAAEMVREWVQEGTPAYGSACINYGRQIPYQPWRKILASILDLTPTLSLQQQMDRLAAGITNLKTPPDQPHYWTDRLPLLAYVLGLEFPENGFTQHLSRELRRNNTFAFVETILRSHAEQQPLLIMLDDIQWADELSLFLAAYLVSALDDSPILLALIHRPISKEDFYDLINVKNLPYAHTIHLSRLSQQESVDLIKILSGSTTLSPKTEALLLSRGQGNPFFMQEIVSAALDVLSDKEKQDIDLLETLDLPETVQDVILARINRLSEEEKLTLKIASVIGANFKRSLLAEVHPMQDSQLALSSQLDTLAGEKLLRLESPAPSWEYAFNNVIAQEVIYEGLQISQRRQLHAVVGKALEALAPEEVEQLAFHYGHSDNWEKALQYLKAAGQKAHREYANQAAIDYYSEILMFLADTNQGPGMISAEYWDILLERGKLYNLTGQRHKEAEDLGTLGLIAEALDDDRRRVLVAEQWGYFYESTGDYVSGLELIERALKLVQQSNDNALVGEVYNQMGKLLYLLGQYKVAYDYLQKALNIAKTHQDDGVQADTLNNLGTVAHYRADYNKSLHLFQQAIDAWQKTGNQIGLGKGLCNLGQVYYDMGQYLAAQQCYIQALDLHRKIGDRSGEALTQHNLGKIHRGLGDFDTAHQLLEQAFSFYLSAGDRHQEGHSLCHLGFLYFRQGKEQIALHFLKESITILREFNDPWALSKALTYYGWALYTKEQFQEAKTHITESLKIQRDTYQDVAAMENMALLGNIALAVNDLSLADTCAQNALSFIEHHSTEGIEHPAMVYLACYHILQTNKNADQAQSALVHGYQYVTLQAAQIDSPGLRQNYLTNIPENQDLVALIESEE